MIIEQKLPITTSMEKEYVNYNFEVKDNINYIKITFEYEKGVNVVDFAIHSNEEFLGATGGEYQEIILTNDSLTTPGYIPGIKSNYEITFFIYKAKYDFDVVLKIEMISLPTKTFNIDFHSHSFCSDGKFTPNQIDILGQKNNLDSIFITDHFSQNSTRYISDNFITKLHHGVELTTKYGHINVYGLQNEQVKYKFPTKSSLINYLDEITKLDNIYISSNHLYASCEGCDYQLEELYDMIEIFNSFDIYSNIKSLSLYQKLLEGGIYIPIIGGSDAHKQQYLDDSVSTHGLPTTLVNARDLSFDEIMNQVIKFNCSVTYYNELDFNYEYKNNSLKIYNDCLKFKMKVYTEKGEVNPDNFNYDKFYRVEFWEKTNNFIKNMCKKLDTNIDIKIDEEYVPIYASNPVFKKEINVNN